MAVGMAEADHLEKRLDEIQEIHARDDAQGSDKQLFAGEHFDCKWAMVLMLRCDRVQHTQVRVQSSVVRYMTCQVTPLLRNLHIHVHHGLS